MLIRPETPEDSHPIRAVHAAAFEPRAAPGMEPVEARLGSELRGGRAPIPPLSLVAVQDGVIAGHVCCSPARLADDGETSVGLGPLGVLPDRQRSGVGSAL